MAMGNAQWRAITEGLEMGNSESYRNRNQGKG